VAYRDQLLVDERFFGPDTGMVEITGAFGEENLEDVAAAEPDLVIGLLGAHDGLREGLLSIAPLYLVDPQGYEGSLQVLELVGELTGRQDEAQEAADAFAAALEEARELAGAQAPVTSMAVYGSTDSLAVDADTTPTGSVLAELGGYPWEALGDGTSLPVSLEEVLEVDPDVVFVQTFSFGATDSPPLSQELAGDPVWSQLSAVRSGRIVEVDPELWGTGRGTRTLTLVLDEAMAAMYPDAS
jgi:iron complex transport system substrate-binding protein